MKVYTHEGVGSLDPRRWGFGQGESRIRKRSPSLLSIPNRVKGVQKSVP